MGNNKLLTNIEFGNLVRGILGLVTGDYDCWNGATGFVVLPAGWHLQDQSGLRWSHRANV